MSKFIDKKVNVVLSIPPEQVKKNIEDNLHQIPSWYGDLFYPNGYEAIIISAGPSMEKYVTELNLKARMEHPHRSFMVFCVKHSLPRLLAMGIEPDFCVILDGRPINADSTHGVNRKSLFEAIPDNTVFLVASMSHKDYGDYLMTHGARVLGWHTSVDGIKEFQEKGIIKEVIISGGTSSGTRCIGLANAMGMRDVTLIGFDSCIHIVTDEILKEKDSKGRPKYIPVDLPLKNPNVHTSDTQQKAIDGLMTTFSNNGFTYQASLQKRFYTTGELLAQAQDFEKILTNLMFDTKFKVFDDGLVGHMAANLPNIAERNYDFVSYVRQLCPRKVASEMPRREVSLESPRELKGDPKVLNPLVSPNSLIQGE